MPFPAFSCHGCNLHLTFMRFHIFQRCIVIALILPFCYCYFVFNVDFYRELFWFYFTMKVAAGHVYSSGGGGGGGGGRRWCPRPLVTALWSHCYLTSYSHAMLSQS